MPPDTVPGVLVLFDVDGTLIRAGDPGHREAFHGAFVEVFGVAATIDGIPLGGNLDRAIARAALRREGVDDRTIDGGLDDLMRALGRRYDPSAVVPLPGVTAAVEAAAPGHVLGVLTGGAQGVARRKLEVCGVHHLLSVGAFGCEAEVRAELVHLAARRAGGVPMSEVTLVGDTPLDVAAARAAGCAVVAVATGRWSIDDLAGTDPDAVLADLTDPEAFLAALDGPAR
jgi:phosphoglycolate phosphatase-like HAD superfamily hydrolase